MESSPTPTHPVIINWYFPLYILFLIFLTSGKPTPLILFYIPKNITN